MLSAEQYQHVLTAQEHLEDQLRELWREAKTLAERQDDQLMRIHVTSLSAQALHCMQIARGVASVLRDEGVPR